MTIRNDFPDFGQAPTFLTHNPTVYAVAGGSTEIVRFDTSSYQYGVLYVGPGGTVVDNDLSFDWMGAVGAEADIIATSPFCRLDNGTIVIPFQVLTPTVRLLDVNSSVYPYNISVGCTLLSDGIYQHGFPGAPFALNQTNPILMGNSITYLPSGCGPGPHFLSIITASTDYDVVLSLWPNQANSYPIVNVTSQSGDKLFDTISLPSTQWTLLVTNNDADADFTVAVWRTPNPT